MKTPKSASKLPSQYTGIRKRFKGYAAALENLGNAAKDAGPLNEKTSHLIQLAAAAAIRSEGAVHSHTRRALRAGAKPGEIRHAIILLTSTIGFPTVSAALSWVDDVLEKSNYFPSARSLSFTLPLRASSCDRERKVR